MAYTLTQLKTYLANLNGEESSPNLASRVLFINQAILDIYEREQWPFRRKTSSITFSNGSATLPTDYAFGDGFGDLRVVNSGTENDNVFVLVDEVNKDNYPAGTYACWVTGNDVDGYTINTNEPNLTCSLVYFIKPTELVNGTDTTLVPNPLAVAYGAIVYLRQYNDPGDVDVTPEIANFEREIAKMRAQYLRNISMRQVSLNERYGSYLGNID